MLKYEYSIVHYISEEPIYIILILYILIKLYYIELSQHINVSF